MLIRKVAVPLNCPPPLSSPSSLPWVIPLLDHVRHNVLQIRNVSPHSTACTHLPTPTQTKTIYPTVSSSLDCARRSFSPYLSGSRGASPSRTNVSRGYVHRPLHPAPCRPKIIKEQTQREWAGRQNKLRPRPRAVFNFNGRNPWDQRLPNQANPEANALNTSHQSELEGAWASSPCIIISVSS